MEIDTKIIAELKNRVSDLKEDLAVTDARTNSLWDMYSKSIEERKYIENLIDALSHTLRFYEGQ